MRRHVWVLALVSAAALAGMAGVCDTASAAPIPLSEFTGEVFNDVYYGPIRFTSASGIDPTKVTVDTASGLFTVSFNGQADAPARVRRDLAFTETVTSALAGSNLALAGASVQGGTGGNLVGPGIVYSETPSPSPAFSFSASNSGGNYGGSGASLPAVSAPSYSVAGSVTLNEVASSTGSVSLSTIQFTYRLAPVPEPSSLALTGVGLLGVLGYGYRLRGKPEA